MAEDKKTNDSEIVKALEESISFDEPYESDFTLIRIEYIKNALYLINRLQADCENYKQVAEHQQSITMDRGFEIKRLKERIESLQAENEVLEARIGVYETCNARKDEAIRKLEAENERFKDYATTVEKEVEWYKDELRHSDKKVATKAYKEVFEKLKDKSIVCKVKLYGKGKFFHCLSAVTLHDIKSLEKELVGEDNI